MNKEIRVAQEIAKKAGVIMRQYFYADQHKTIKDDGTPLTIADTTINRMVIEELENEFPDDGIIGEEESTSEYGMGRKWLCDPIDGTKAYTWGIPTAMFSLGLVVDGQPILGVAYDPFQDLMYVAETGKGAFCNDEPIHVSKLILSEGTLAITSGAKEIRKNQAYLNKLIDSAGSVAVFSGAVYKSVLVARGKLVGFALPYLTAHDMAAVHVIIEEAGGKVTDINGNKLDYSLPFRGAIASNSVVHDELVEALKLR